MKKILYISSESFPYGKAYASRTRAIVKALILANNDVTILCDQKNKMITGECYRVEQAFNKQYKGIIKHYLVPLLYAQKLDTMLNQERYDLVISRSMYDRYNAVYRVIREHDIPFVLESCECYNVKSFKRGKLDLRYKQFLHLWSSSRYDVDGVIAISRYIENYYNMYCPVLRIPGILDINYIPTQDRKIGRPVKLIYSGDITGGKEILDVIIQALKQFPNSIIFDIYGPSKEEVVKIWEQSHPEEAIEGNIIVHGRVPQESLYEIFRDSDFGIFIRPKRISSEAGFPTKLGEYMAAGLPVIANTTGDIPLVLNDKYNGFLLDNGTLEELVDVFNEVLSMSTEEYKKMSYNAVNTVDEMLIPNKYSEELDLFLDGIIDHFYQKL